MHNVAQIAARVESFVRTNKRPLIVILGPTASGKTTLSIELSKKLNGEIVSADSRQVYRGMDIGTDKIKDTWKVPHHVIDVVNPDEPFTLVQYKEMAEGAIDDILARGNVPFLVGGTMLYIDAVVKNFQIPSSKVNSQWSMVSRDLREQLEQQSNEKLLAQLQKLDPECARGVDPKNKRRLVRALEYCLQTGGKFSRARNEGPRKYTSFMIGLDVPRAELYSCIDARIDKQVRAGLVEETRTLAEKYGYDIPPMSALGYRQVGRYLQGECSLEEAVQRLKFDTHAYARRQLVWWRKNKDIVWITIGLRKS